MPDLRSVNKFQALGSQLSQDEKERKIVTNYFSFMTDVLILSAVPPTTISKEDDCKAAR